MYDLSIVVPSRCEMFISDTVRDILKNKRGKTEIIVVLDGAWAEPGLEDHPDVRVIYLGESRGQRAATNLGVKLSQAKYVAKCDAHTAYDEGFDIKLMEAMKGHDNWTVVPIMRNLHVFDWVCDNGHRRYQGPSGLCQDCGQPTRRDILWNPKPSPQSKSYCFDSEPHFQYENAFTKRPGYERGIITGYDVSINSGASSTLVQGSPLSVGGSQPASLTGIINLLTGLTSTHHLLGSSDGSSNRKDVPTDTMSLAPIDSSRSVASSEVLGIGNELEVGGVTTSPVLTEVVDNGDILSSAPGNLTDKPSIDESVRHFVIPEIGQVSISGSIAALLPVPTAGDTINSNIIKKLNDEIGGQFIYNEKAGSFHNGSVALTPIYNKSITPTMSLQGSFFMLTREKYWELNICDEKFGSWGSQGIEVAVKTWLSGGEVMCVQTTWYAHLFRTQGGDFSFPYPQSGKQVSKAKAMAKDLFFENKWPQQTKPLSWLLEKFWPIKGWTDEDLAKVKQFDSVVTHEPSKGIIYYTTNQLPVKLAKRVQNQIKAAHLPIVSASLKPMDNMGKNIHVKRRPGIETYFTQIVAALETSTADIIFFTEHDVMYSPTHFDFTPPDKNKFYYNTHVWRVRADGKAVTWEANQVAELCCYRELALEWYREKLKEVQDGRFNRSYEPGGRNKKLYEQWRSDAPNIDIRHDSNLTKSKWSPDDFRDKSTCVNWQEITIDQITDWPDLSAIL